MWLQLFFIVTLSPFLLAAPRADEDTTPSPTDMFWELAKAKEMYTVPPLPFSFKEMEPYIDAETMELHYSVILKEHATKLNNVMKKWRSLKEDKSGLVNKSLIEIWRSKQKIPDENDIRRDFYHFGGGYINHILYFSTMTPNSKGIERSQTKNIAKLIEYSFHNLTGMKKDVDLLVGEQHGPGWVYLARATKSYSDGEYLTVVSSNDESVPLDNQQLYPVLALDLWEHAYFKRYGTQRGKYIANWWKTVDWVKVERILNWWREVYPDGHGKRSEL